MKSVVLALCLLAGCTTGRYENQAQEVSPDTFRFKVYVGGFAGDEQALSRLTPDLELFKAERRYSGYTVQSRYYAPFPLSHYDFTVKFLR